jgi:hypothetical protein
MKVLRLVVHFSSIWQTCKILSDQESAYKRECPLDKLVHLRTASILWTSQQKCPSWWPATIQQSSPHCWVETGVRLYTDKAKSK